MGSRGALDSATCEFDSIASRIERLRADLSARSGGEQRVHWVVQQLLSVVAKGHLSNERRIAEDKRDWVAEVEGSVGHAADIRPISLRTWRDNRLPRVEPLLCHYREKYTQALATVARWAYERLVRVHFEWVWDGRAIYLVQADQCEETPAGVEPKHLVHVPKKSGASAKKLAVFREATSQDYQDYRKLANTRVYREIGYGMVPFYVLDDPREIELILKNGICSDALQADLAILVVRPLVIRSDGRSVPDDLKQMLPRSQELRSLDAAVAWLLAGFRASATSQASSSGTALAECRPCLIAHHFVPATAAAWCQARPDHRRVRIESLWGLPEGLYWYAYDAYDVDTQRASTLGSIPRPKQMQIRERRRYKERFVAPDADGNWVLHRTAAGPDWQRSVRNKAWLEEIAWTSRLIATVAGHPVVVMWFVDVPPAASKHRVLPWYHEQWHGDASPHKAAPRRKLSATQDFVLRNKADWERLKASIAEGQQIVRVRVHPSDPDIVREREFVEQLAPFAKEHRLVVELEGGVLSHAYYMLSREGCEVECADLDDYATEDFELEFNKLVRDKIPAAIAARGEGVTALRLEGAALIAALRRKLVEESLEVLDAATTESIADEIADVREVVLALMSRLGIADADVEARRRQKAKARGSFDDALMLKKTAVVSSMSLRGLQAGEEHSENLVSATISREAEIPHIFEDMHVDRRVDAAGVAERQFTVDVPAHAGGFQPVRVPFNLETPNGKNHEMFFELQLDRRGSELRVRARVLNSPIQMELAFHSQEEAPSPDTDPVV